MGERYVIKDRWIFDTKLNKNIHSIDCYEEKNVLDIMNGQNERIAELEEQLKNCIKPKFKIGQDVIVFDWSGQLRNGRVYEIQTNSVLHDKQQLITYLVDFYENYEDDDRENDYYEEKEVFATKEEVEQKLAEIGGKDE